MKEYDTDSMEQEDEVENRRLVRRRRRKSNEIIVWVFSALLLISLVVGGIFGVGRVVKLIQDKKYADELAKQLETVTQEEEPVVVEAPQTIEEEETDTVLGGLDELVEECISVLSLEDKAAGLFMITPEALTGTGIVIQAGQTTEEKLAQYPVGGLIYFSQNIKDREQLTEMLANTVSFSKYPIFLGVDEEGGRVARVGGSSIDVPAIEPMGAIGAEGNADSAYEAGTTIGSYLSEFGFNVNFAPIADVIPEEGDSSIGDRSFGYDAGIVSEMVAAAVEGFQSTGISSCLKHFPGIGDLEGDTHDGSVISEKTKEELYAKELLPFQAGIESGVPFIMVSHLSLPNIVGDNTPSSLSSAVITDLLRGEMGYDGIVVTDSFSMGAVTEYYTSAEAAVMAIQAGADLILMPEDFEEAYQGVLDAVAQGTITEERLNESLRRIYRVKYRDQAE